MLVLYLGEKIGLGYNDKLMKCCVNIIYTIVIFDNTSILDIEHSQYYIAIGSTQTYKMI